MCRLRHSCQGCLNGMSLVSNCPLDREVYESSSLDEAIKLLLSTNSALLEAGVMTDYDKVYHLTRSAQIASGGLNSAQIITALRWNGKFEQADLIDKIL